MELEFINEFQISKPLSKEINRLLIRCFPDASYAERDYFKQLPHYRILAKHEEQLIGQVAIDFRVMNLNNSPLNVMGVIDLCVDPEFQKQGIAKELMRVLEKVATDNLDKIDCLLLVTDHPLFYEKIGFKTVDITTKWLKIDNHENYGLGNEKIEDAYFMVKQISNKKWEDGELDYLGYMY